MASLLFPEVSEYFKTLSNVFFAAAEAFAAAALALAAVRAARTADLTSSAALTADDDSDACQERAKHTRNALHQENAEYVCATHIILQFLATGTYLRKYQ